MIPCLAVAFVFFLSGLLQGLAGFGSSLVAMPVLLFLVDIKTAVPLCILNGMALTVLMGIRLRGHLDARKVAPLLIGLPAGIAMGVFFLSQVDGSVTMFLLGLFIIAYALYTLLVSPKPRPLHPAWGTLAGFCSGVISAGFSGGGPPVIIYSQLAGWRRDQFKATLAVYFILVTIFSTAGHAMAGLLTSQVLLLLACSVPFVVPGALLGMYFSTYVSEEAFRRGVLLLLLILGAATSLRAMF